MPKIGSPFRFVWFTDYYMKAVGGLEEVPTVLLNKEFARINCLKNKEGAPAKRGQDGVWDIHWEPEYGDRYPDVCRIQDSDPSVAFRPGYEVLTGEGPPSMTSGDDPQSYLEYLHEQVKASPILYKNKRNETLLEFAVRMDYEASKDLPGRERATAEKALVVSRIKKALVETYLSGIAGSAAEAALTGNLTSLHTLLQVLATVGLLSPRDSGTQFEQIMKSWATFHGEVFDGPSYATAQGRTKRLMELRRRQEKFANNSFRANDPSVLLADDYTGRYIPTKGFNGNPGLEDLLAPIVRALLQRDAWPGRDVPTGAWVERLCVIDRDVESIWESDEWRHARVDVVEGLHGSVSEGSVFSMRRRQVESAVHDAKNLVLEYLGFSTVSPASAVGGTHSGKAMLGGSGEQDSDLYVLPEKVAEVLLDPGTRFSEFLSLVSTFTTLRLWNKVDLSTFVVTQSITRAYEKTAKARAHRVKNVTNDLQAPLHDEEEALRQIALTGTQSGRMSGKDHLLRVDSVKGLEYLGFSYESGSGETRAHPETGETTMSEEKSKFATMVRGDAEEAARRVAVKKVVRLVREPLASLIAASVAEQKEGEDEPRETDVERIRAKVASLLRTDEGEAVVKYAIASTWSLVRQWVPENLHWVGDSVAQELRVQSMETGMEKILEVVGAFVIPQLSELALTLGSLKPPAETVKKSLAEKIRVQNEESLSSNRDPVDALQAVHNERRRANGAS